ncbi:MAG: hypothetical protein ABJC51_01310, partial [Acidobacteriota bacterium]
DGRPLSEPGAAGGGASLSPDGTTVAYSLSRSGMGAGQGWSNNGGGLWLTHLDTEPKQTELLATNAERPTWSRDGQRLAYSKLRPEMVDPLIHYPASALTIRQLNGAERELSPWDATQMLVPSDWAPDNQSILVSVMDPRLGVRLALWPVSRSRRELRTVLAIPDTTLWNATYSPNGRWLALVAVNAQGGTVGVTSADGPPSRPWRRVMSENTWVDKPHWASDGKRLYFISKRGFFVNLWSVQFDPEQGVPVGTPTQVTHFESPDFMISPRVDFMDIAVSAARIVTTMRTATGNIWMLDNVDR